MVNPNTKPVPGDGLGINEVANTFEDAVDKADGLIREAIDRMNDPANTEGPTSTDAMEFQRLMANQSIMVQTGTGSIKSLKDSIMSAVRNI